VRSRLTADGALGGELDHAAGEQHQHQPCSDGRRRSDTGGQVAHPPDRVPAALPASAEQGGTSLGSDRRDSGSAPRASTDHPQRRRAAQEQCGEGEDHDQAGHDERGTAHERSGPAAEPPGAEDSRLGRGRAWQQVAGGDRVLELLRVQRLALLDAQVTQQLDVGRRAAEPDAADPAPLPGHRAQRRPGQCRRITVRGEHGFHRPGGS